MGSLNAPAEMPRPARSWRRLAVPTLAVLIVIVLLEGLSWVALFASRRLLEEEIRTTRDIFREQQVLIRRLVAPGESRLLAIDSVLGWRYKAGHVDSTNQTNEQGVRSRRIYAPKPPPGVLRIAAFGDSFIYGNEVANDQCWATVVEGLDPRLEVLNYGVGGYGVDQAYLRFRLEGDRLAPRVVVMGFVPGNIGRAVNVYRRFLSNRELPLAKPRYVLGADGQLDLLPGPIRDVSQYARYLANPGRVRELGRHDYWYEPAVYENVLHDVSATVRLLTGLWVKVRRRYFDGQRLVQDGVFNRESAAFKIHVALFRQFDSDVRERGALPLVVFFPDLEAVLRGTAGQLPAYAPLQDELREHGIDYLDLREAFLAAAPTTEVQDWFMPGGHYSPSANQIVAAWLQPRLFERVRENGF
jgi:hypothetical protein